MGQSVRIIAMASAQRPTVMILFGGQSSEHQISCATAAGVLEAIDHDKWDVHAVGISPEGVWVPQSADPEEYRLGSTGGYTVQPGAKQLSFVPGPNRAGGPRLVELDVDQDGIPVPGSARNVADIDVVFPLLHGPYGEDGSLQGLLELLPARYVGCGISASAVAMDKRLAKTVLDGAGVPTGEWEPVTLRQWQREPGRVTSRLQRLGLPIFVKPCRAGSSMGITRVTNWADLPEAISTAGEHDPQLIVEAANRGREVECGVLELPDGQLVASPLGEIVVSGGFYDYETKYFSPDGVQLSCPADIPEIAADQIRAAAKTAFEALGAEGLARVDFFYEEETGRFTVNEVNTMPGFTPHSMYPRMLAAAGYDYSELVNVLLQGAFGRPQGLR